MVLFDKTEALSSKSPSGSKPRLKAPAQSGNTPPHPDPAPHPVTIRPSLLKLSTMASFFLPSSLHLLLPGLGLSVSAFLIRSFRPFLFLSLGWSTGFLFPNFQSLDLILSRHAASDTTSRHLPGSSFRSFRESEAPHTTPPTQLLWLVCRQELMVGFLKAFSRI